MVVVKPPIVCADGLDQIASMIWHVIDVKEKFYLRTCDLFADIDRQEIRSHIYPGWSRLLF